MIKRVGIGMGMGMIAAVVASLGTSEVLPPMEYTGALRPRRHEPIRPSAPRVLTGVEAAIVAKAEAKRARKAARFEKTLRPA